MKGKVFAARKRLSQIITKAEKLGIDLQNSNSASALRQSCGLADTTTVTSASLLLLGLGLLTVILALASHHRHRLVTSQCPSNWTQELHIQTLSWRLPPDEGLDPPGPCSIQAEFSPSDDSDHEDLDRLYDKLYGGNV